jgi:hypothetical protein
VTRAIRNLKAAGEEFAAAILWYKEQRPGLGGEFFDVFRAFRFPSSESDGISRSWSLSAIVAAQ